MTEWTEARRDALHGISETYFDYAEAADSGDVAAFAALFTENCRFDGGPPAKGRDAIQRHAARVLGLFSATSHHISNIRIRALSGPTADATASVIAWHRKLDGETFMALGRYETVF